MIVTVYLYHGISSRSNASLCGALVGNVVAL